MADAMMAPSCMRRRRTAPASVATRRSPSPTNERDALAPRPLCPRGTGISPMGIQEDCSCVKRATRSGMASSIIAAWSLPLIQVAAAAARRAPSGTGSLAGAPSAGPQAQLPASGREPGQWARWPWRVTTVRPALPQWAPTSGGRCISPPSWMLIVFLISVRGPPSCTAEPKPRGVKAARAPLGPQASSWGSKKLGHEMGSGAILGPASACWTVATRFWRACEKPTWLWVSWRRRPRFSMPTWRFSSCQAICSGMNGFSAAAHGRPMGVPSSWISIDWRDIGGRDQWGAVTRPCSPMAMSTRFPKMRKTQPTHCTACMATTSFHGWTSLLCAQAGEGEWKRLVSPVSSSLPLLDALPLLLEALEEDAGISPLITSFAMPPLPFLISRTMSFWPGCSLVGGSTW
mmetsp:Transcript_74014/g.216841  ORF Transcript_74014/g.216841 Transcript_74014/m.216841 type:complete len:403 (+) Transcript_74014:274-1482(+)